MLKKSILLSVIFAFTLSFLAFSNAESQTVPKISVKTNKKSYNPGESGVLTIKFKTAENVKIPTEPQIEVTLNGASGTGLQGYPGGDYIESKQVKYGFTVSGDAVSGSTVTISGSVKFGYCNSDSGICKIGTQKFSVKIKIK
jgi:ABC-type Fe3+-hydroxamate transport system substrate-binding protein